MKKPRFKVIPSYYPIPDSKGGWISRGTLQFYSAIMKCTIVVPSKTYTDLASIPKVLRSFTTVNDTHRVCAALHDYLYKLLKEGQRSINGKKLTRKIADMVFLEAMASCKAMCYQSLPENVVEIYKQMTGRQNINECYGVPLVDWYTRNKMYLGVRVGGWVHV